MSVIKARATNSNRIFAVNSEPSNILCGQKNLYLCSLSQLKPPPYFWTDESRALLSPPLLFPTFLTSRRTQLSERLKQATNIYEVM